MGATMKSSAAIVATAVLATQCMMASAEQVGCTSTTFKLIGPNDKVCVQAFDDPKVPGVACHISQARTGGVKGAVGLAEDPSRFAIACRQVGPITLPAKLVAGRRGLQHQHVDLVQGDARGSHVRRETQHARLCCGQYQADRRLADEFDIDRADHAVGGALAAIAVVRLRAAGCWAVRYSTRSSTRLSIQTG